MSTATRHNEEWPIEESIQFLNMYLDGVKTTDQTKLCSTIATELGRTTNAIKLRVKEVNRILTGEYDFPEITPNMASAVDQIMAERNMSATRMGLLF